MTNTFKAEFGSVVAVKDAVLVDKSHNEQHVKIVFFDDGDAHNHIEHIKGTHYSDSDKNIVDLMHHNVRECLAALEHEQWMQWAQSILKTEHISPDRVQRWGSLMIPYDDLTEDQKDADREWADRALQCVKEHPPNIDAIVDKLYLYYADEDGELFEIPLAKKWIIEDIVMAVLDVEREL